MLFILALEPLIRTLKKEVQGIGTPMGYFKLVLFADDLTIGLGANDGVEKVLHTLSRFGEHSGLEINKGKCELLSLKNKSNEATEIKTVHHIKITGVYFGTKENMKQTENLNFEPPLANIDKKLLFWRMRVIPLAGRTVATKAHALSQCQFISSAVKTPQWAIKRIENSVYHYVWQGKSRVNKIKASRKWHNGGIAFSQPENVVNAAHARTLIRAFSMPDATWAANIIYELNKRGGVSILHPQTNLTALRKDRTFHGNHYKKHLIKSGPKN